MVYNLHNSIRSGLYARSCRLQKSLFNLVYSLSKSFTTNHSRSHLLSLPTLFCEASFHLDPGGISGMMYPNGVCVSLKMSKVPSVLPEVGTGNSQSKFPLAFILYSCQTDGGEESRNDKRQSFAIN